MLAQMRAVALRIGDPRLIRLEQQIEVGRALARRALDPLGSVAVVVARVHDGALEIGVEQLAVAIVEQQRKPAGLAGKQRGPASHQRFACQSAPDRPLQETHRYGGRRFPAAGRW